MKKFTCEVCGGLPKSPSAYEQHLKTSKHIKNVGLKNDSVERPIHQCNICDKTFSTSKTRDLHFYTKLHKEREERVLKGLPAIELPKERGPRGRPKGTKNKIKLSCSICDKNLTSEYHLERHMSKHNRRPRGRPKKESSD